MTRLALAPGFGGAGAFGPFWKQSMHTTPPECGGPNAGIVVGLCQNKDKLWREPQPMTDLSPPNGRQLFSADLACVVMAVGFLTACLLIG